MAIQKDDPYAKWGGAVATAPPPDDDAATTGKPPAAKDPYSVYGGSIAQAAAPAGPPAMSRAQADVYMDNVLTHGAGTWQTPKQPKFSDVVMVDPEAPELGGKIPTVAHPSFTSQDIAQGKNLVPLQDVSGIRTQLQFDAAHPDLAAQREAAAANAFKYDSSQPLAERIRRRAGTHARQVTEETNQLDATNNKWLDYAGGKGADAAEAAVRFGAKTFQDDPNATPAEIGIARSVGKNVTRIAADPTTYATLALGGTGGKAGQVALSALFSAGAAKGSYDAAGQLGSIWDRPDISSQQKAEMATDLVLNTAMAGMAGAHAVKVPLLEGSEPFLSGIPPEARAAVAQKVNSTLSKTKGIIYNAASKAGDVMADVANADRENVDVPDPRLQVKQRVASAANSLGVKLNSADNALQAISQAKQDRLMEAQNAAGPGKTIEDLAPDQRDQLNTHLDLLDTMEKHITEGRDTALENANNPPPTRGEAATAALTGAAKMAAGHAATMAAQAMGIPPSFSLLAEIAGLTGGGRQFVRGVKGVLSRRPLTPDVHDAMVEKAFSNAQPIDQPGLSQAQNDAAQSIFTAFPGDTSVTHDSLIFPPETPHGNANMIPDVPNPRFQMSSSSTAQPFTRPPIITPQGPGLISRARALIEPRPIELNAQSESTLEPTIRQRNIEAIAADPAQQWTDIRGFLQRHPDASPQQIREAVASAIAEHGILPSAELPDMGDTGVSPSTSIGKNLTPRYTGRPPRADVVATSNNLTPDRFASFPRQMSGEAAAAHWLAGQNLNTLRAIAEQRGISFNPGGDLNGSLISKIVDSMNDKELQELEAASIERSRFPRAQQPPEQPPQRTVGTPPGRERRQDLNFRSAVEKMPPEQQARAIFFSDKTGLPNYRAFNQSAGLLSHTHPIVGYADVDDFKEANTTLGKDAVDTKLLPMIGEAFYEAAQNEPGVHVFHRSGDEFLFRADDPAAVQRVVNRVNEKIQGEKITAQRADGSTAEYQAKGLSQGTGATEDAAELAAEHDKQARKAAGLRTGARDTAQPSDIRGMFGGQQQPRRPGIIANATVPASSLEPGQAGMVKTSDLKVDPERFQYKGNVNEEGVTNALKDQKKYEPNFGGVLLTWKDPANGQPYVVNGHHRFELAQRTGEPSVLVRAIDARDANEAQAVGALTNISEGRGTAVDAARFIKNSGMGPDELERRGLPMSEGKLQDGLALAKLDRSILDKVESGKIPEGRGIAIGRATEDPAQQEAILKLVDKQEARGRRVTNDTVAELSRFVKNSGNKTVEQGGLFGPGQEIHSLALEKADVSAYVKGQIAKERRTFGAVASLGKAETLSRVEGQSIKADENARIAEQAAQALEAYDKLSSMRGPVNDILESAAKEMAAGYSKPEAVRAKAYERIREELQRTIGGGHEQPAQERRP